VGKSSPVNRYEVLARRYKSSKSWGYNVSLSALVGTRRELDVCKLIPRWLLHCLVIICPGHDHAKDNALRPCCQR